MSTDTAYCHVPDRDTNNQNELTYDAHPIADYQWKPYKFSSWF
jgi:hypothetical protein